MPDKSVHQLYDFLNRDGSGGTRVWAEDAPSSVKKVPRDGVASLESGTTIRNTDVEFTWEHDSGWASSNEGTLASQVPMLLSSAIVSAQFWPFGLILPLGLFLPLRGVSPRAGSSESGRGMTDRFGCGGVTGVPSLELAVMHDRSKRTAWSRGDSVSRAV